MGLTERQGIIVVSCCAVGGLFIVIIIAFAVYYSKCCSRKGKKGHKLEKKGHMSLKSGYSAGQYAYANNNRPLAEDTENNNHLGEGHMIKTEGFESVYLKSLPTDATPEETSSKSKRLQITRAHSSYSLTRQEKRNSLGRPVSTTQQHEEVKLKRKSSRPGKRPAPKPPTASVEPQVRKGLDGPALKVSTSDEQPDEPSSPPYSPSTTVHQTPLQSPPMVERQVTYTLPPNEPPPDYAGSFGEGTLLQQNMDKKITAFGQMRQQGELREAAKTRTELETEVRSVPNPILPKRQEARLVPEPIPARRYKKLSERIRDAPEPSRGKLSSAGYSYEAAPKPVKKKKGKKVQKQRFDATGEVGNDYSSALPLQSTTLDVRDSDGREIVQLPQSSDVRVHKVSKQSVAKVKPRRKTKNEKQVITTRTTTKLQNDSSSPTVPSIVVEAPQKDSASPKSPTLLDEIQKNLQTRNATAAIATLETNKAGKKIKSSNPLVVELEDNFEKTERKRLTSDDIDTMVRNRTKAGKPANWGHVKLQRVDNEEVEQDVVLDVALNASVKAMHENITTEEDGLRVSEGFADSNTEELARVHQTTIRTQDDQDISRHDSAPIRERREKDLNTDSYMYCTDIATLERNSILRERKSEETKEQLVPSTAIERTMMTVSEAESSSIATGDYAYSNDISGSSVDLPNKEEIQAVTARFSPPDSTLTSNAGSFIDTLVLYDVAPEDFNRISRSLTQASALRRRGSDSLKRIAKSKRLAAMKRSPVRKPKTPTIVQVSASRSVASSKVHASRDSLDDLDNLNGAKQLPAVASVSVTYQTAHIRNPVQQQSSAQLRGAKAKTAVAPVVAAAYEPNTFPQIHSDNLQPATMTQNDNPTYSTTFKTTERYEDTRQRKATPGNSAVHTTSDPRLQTTNATYTTVLKAAMRSENDGMRKPTSDDTAIPPATYSTVLTAATSSEKARQRKPPPSNSGPRAITSSTAVRAKKQTKAPPVPKLDVNPKPPPERLHYSRAPPSPPRVFTFSPPYTQVRRSRVVAQPRNDPYITQSQLTRGRIEKVRRSYSRPVTNQVVYRPTAPTRTGYEPVRPVRTTERYPARPSDGRTVLMRMSDDSFV